ncbi:MAG: hypothetical protein ACTSUJ_05370 [Candidatus Njordarchaeales archaeon]
MVEIASINLPAYYDLSRGVSRARIGLFRIEAEIDFAENEASNVVLRILQLPLHKYCSTIEDECIYFKLLPERKYGKQSSFASPISTDHSISFDLSSISSLFGSIINRNTWNNIGNNYAFCLGYYTYARLQLSQRNFSTPNYVFIFLPLCGCINCKGAKKREELRDYRLIVGGYGEDNWGKKNNFIFLLMNKEIIKFLISQLNRNKKELGASLTLDKLLDRLKTLEASLLD